MTSLLPYATVFHWLSRRLIKYGSMCIGSSMIAAGTINQKQLTSSSRFDKITFGTNSLAQAEHGGFYQAIATGIYKDQGLDLTIKIGGTQLPNGTQLLIGRAVDFFIGNAIDAINTTVQAIPKITVAAIFQKNSQCLVIYPNTATKTPADLRSRPILCLSSKLKKN